MASEEEYRGQDACKQFGRDLADAFRSVSRPSFGAAKPTRATLTTGLKLALGVMGGAERSAWVRENREHVARVEVFVEEEQAWEVRWEGGQWQ